ncbi:recombinase family protein [Singulisphaera acidiphila]|uniref:Site-specific recombinase, DNA invertase Pin n=1 Tax=Singulisphaera acidiphila (strain ATCC BAA-1392 / DSM 18658 / VKM B-2454 / MOB10) TaxID=886293 RepID=L0DJB8_SINAD|nr:recombinase family protein [Singulisphaera acidiphila]AGA28930.1 site-specific recombinase, DNA invertase Pin [Singulisphaera acidiphila DSM 18658]
MFGGDLITPAHLARRAVIYIRQSSPQQVISHQESLRLQYDLRQQALACGWPDSAIEVIDCDLGLTARTTQGRAGFADLVSRVTLGDAGIIFFYDATRLSRNCSDWYQLLDLCGFRRCLIADHDSVYDPSSINGRMLLGLKGQISELELHTIKARLTAGLLNKARRGELAQSLPVGLVRDLSGRVVKHPDQEVRERIDFVFATFLRVKSIHGVVRDLAAARLLLPRRERGRDDGAIVWRRATAAAISSLLRNPAYEGTFVYGRTRFLPRVPGGPSRKHPLTREEWQFVVPDKYPAYIDREAFATIQAMLRDNYQEYSRRRSRGAARSGTALLQGLACCGHCGNKMTVQYHAAARYLYSHHKAQGGGPECQRVPIPMIDAWVVGSFWEALSSAELDRYDAAVAGIAEQQRQLRRAHDLQIKRLQYEARLAEKQYRLVDPENRLVAAELERRWEHALQALRQAEEGSSSVEATFEPLSDDLRRQLDEARPSLRQMWDDGTLSNIHKKELLRDLIGKVVLRRPAADKCEARIIWKGGDWTTALLDLPVVTYAEMEKGEELIDEVVRRAQAGESDQQIAAELTAAGYHAPLKRRLGVESVRRIREKHGVSARRTEFQRHGLPGWISLGEAVRRLGEHTSWAYYLIRLGRLQIERDPVIGLYLVPDRKKPLKKLKELLRGQRFSLIVERRSS